MIADRLNADGLRPPKRIARFGAAQVRTLMNQHAIRTPNRRGRLAALGSLGPDEWTVTDLAAALQMPTASVYNWIYRGWITARHHPEGKYWIITADAAELDRLRERRSRPPGYYTRARFTGSTPPTTRPSGGQP
ncbi:hypothetical protein C9F11_44390 (plasmid) [Streptomyces sp. YIM 121038]|uniref:hypothetical protein n=1 Tax=Streptomyces sp. YIM 121038 TaxID=2136401 RepID=UPI001110B638|nr:hypothetical protein [Streptomyces sp. YIM 121038]QCX82450.1 hypothetical protein C9F11_44390 [Streptomyces sp. YIM 121038]